jgi:hypothetical protein
MCNSYDFITMLVKNIILTLILSLPIFVFSQQDTVYIEDDTTYYDEPNPSEYFKVHKGNSYSYLKNGGDYDTIIETIANDIRKGGIFMTNRDVNVNINSLALDRRKDSLGIDKSTSAISDYIDNSRAEESISLFCYYMTDSLKNDFVLRIFDETESCTCSESAFDEIIGYKEIADAIVNKNLKWMTFSYFQHYNKDGFLDEYIFVEYKIRWHIGRSFTLILEGNE